MTADTYVISKCTFTDFICYSKFFFLKRIESVNDSLLIRPFLDIYYMPKNTTII